jgi:hypothetical protein
VTSPVLQLRVRSDVLERIDEARGDDTRSAWVLRLIDRELSGQQRAEEGPVKTSSTPAASSLGAIAPGEPSHGAICMTPGCWERDTRKYGLRKLPLCTACAAALQGQEYKREIPPGAQRLLKGGTAA